MNWNSSWVFSHSILPVFGPRKSDQQGGESVRFIIVNSKVCLLNYGIIFTEKPVLCYLPWATPGTISKVWVRKPCSAVEGGGGGAGEGGGGRQFALLWVTQ